MSKEGRGKSREIELGIQKSDVNEVLDIESGMRRTIGKI